MVDIAPNIHNWIESGRHILGSGNFTKIGGRWGVPNAPSDLTEQPTSFFFNGLASNNSCDNGQWSCYLMQPVLGYGCARHPANHTCAVGENSWWHAPILWTSVPEPNTFYYSGPTTDITTGHQIQGNVTWTNPADECSGNPGKGYRIVSRDLDASGDSWTLTWCDTTTVFGKGYAAVFEAKGCAGGNCNGGGISQCDNLPDSPNINFTAISSYHTNGGGVSWDSIDGGQTPNCGWQMVPAFSDPPSANFGPIRLRWNPDCSSPPCAP